MLPFLGPSDVRDAFGRVGDDYSTPRTLHPATPSGTTGCGRSISSTGARGCSLDRLLDSAYDPYAFVRNAYLQNRDFKVSGGHSPSEEEQEQKMLKEAGAEEQAPPRSLRRRSLRHRRLKPRSLRRARRPTDACGAKRGR